MEVNPMTPGIQGLNSSGFGAAAAPPLSGQMLPPADESFTSPSAADTVELAARRPASRSGKKSVDDRIDESKGNRVAALFDKKQIFDEAKSMIKGAQSLVQVEMYELTNPDMVKLLASEVKKGVKVQVILDRSPGFDAERETQKQKALEKLESAGVQVVFYPTRSSNSQIDHVKLLIVDGRSVLMGGMNWGTHSPYNHDQDFKIEGPAVNFYEDVFAEDWKVSKGTRFVRPPKAEELPDGKATVMSATTNYFRKGIQSLLHAHLDEAKKSIHVELFILSDDKVIKKLIEAHERGVDVKVMLDPNGVESGWSPNGESFKKLKKAGVPVKWYDVNKETKQKLHGKWAVFDGKAAMGGSSNWSFKGLNINREIASFVRDDEQISVMEKQFQSDWDTRGVDTRPDVP